MCVCGVNRQPYVTQAMAHDATQLTAESFAEVLNLVDAKIFTDGKTVGQIEAEVLSELAEIQCRFGIRVPAITSGATAQHMLYVQL